MHAVCSPLPSLSEGMELWALCSWDAPNNGAQHSTPVTFFPAGVRNAHSRTCQMKLSPAVSKERKQFGSAEHVWADGRWALPSWEGKHLFLEARSAWACKKSWGKKAELCLPSPFPAALRKEGNRCHPFKTSMSVTTTAWTKPDVVSRAVKPDTSQTALRAGQCSLRFSSHLLHFLKWRPQAHNSVSLPSAQKSPSSSWHLWEKTLHSLRLCWVTRKGNFLSSLVIQEAQQCCNLKRGAWFQISKSSHPIPLLDYVIGSKHVYWILLLVLINSS